MFKFGVERKWGKKNVHFSTDNSPYVAYLRNGER